MMTMELCDVCKKPATFFRCGAAGNASSPTVVTGRFCQEHAPSVRDLFGLATVTDDPAHKGVQPIEDEDTGQLTYPLDLRAGVTYAHIEVMGATLIISGNHEGEAQIAILADAPYKLGIGKVHDHGLGGQGALIFVSQGKAEATDAEAAQP